ncbi:hypothetical protein M2163_002186 [Streptomyces sp. SAI-135]|nr:MULTISPECIES: hypothetical protein [unclassified Streptomyces]MDH6520830.1 hypothetical protein [Streptomyces sp. SAI-090]MDH6553049.1 hypothetical protein [Streptomyces sp. SAI-041]MDH6615078.1 hypothetical protein [Streptomyces sp. SAI-135]
MVRGGWVSGAGREGQERFVACFADLIRTQDAVDRAHRETLRAA